MTQSLQLKGFHKESKGQLKQGNVFPENYRRYMKISAFHSLQRLLEFLSKEEQS